MKKIITNLWRRFIPVAWLLFASLSPVFAQQTRTVTGTVTGSDDGKPIPGVSVIVKEGKGGAATDANGRYTITADAAAQLIFRAVGYEEQVLSAASTTLNVVLKS